MPTITSAEAAAAIRDHHTQLADGLRTRVIDLTTAVRDGGPFESPRDQVVAYLEAEIVPHAAAEERTIYPAAEDGPAAPLVAAMRDEHVDLIHRVGELRVAADAVAAIEGAGAIAALFMSHLGKENDRLIPALLEMPQVSLGDLLADMHELVG